MRNAYLASGSDSPLLQSDLLTCLASQPTPPPAAGSRIRGAAGGLRTDVSNKTDTSGPALAKGLSQAATCMAG